MEKGIRRFSLVLSYINFLFRVVVMLALWKVSSLVERRQEKKEARGGQEERESGADRLGNLKQQERPNPRNPFEA